MKQSALLVDFYALTMVNAYYKFKPKARATFDLVLRSLPNNRSFVLACGINDVLSYLEKFSFTKNDISYLSRQGFSRDFLRFLGKLRFNGEVWAVKEGTIIFPQEPILRITASLAQAQLVESYLLNTINIHTTLASKAVRVVMAAENKPVFDFSLRRTQGVDAGLKAAQTSYIAGCEGTSNVLAGRLFGIKVVGTMAHSYVLAFATELESFRAYAEVFPGQSTLLIDTYDYAQGIKNAIFVARELKLRGFKLLGVRLDSGNLSRESRKIRKILDKNGLEEVKILASGNLDEYKIDKLIKNKVPIDSFGVGTNMGVSADAPYCDVVYKLSELAEEGSGFVPRMKLSRRKKTLPGRKQVYRQKNGKGYFSRDILALEGENIKGRPLLSKMMDNGRILAPERNIDTARKYVKSQLRKIPPEYKQLKSSAVYPVVMSRRLEKLTARTGLEIKEREHEEQKKEKKFISLF